MSDEAAVLARYILGTRAEEADLALYARAMNTQHSMSTKRDARRTAFAIAHPWSIGPLDAAMALLAPQAPLRRKLIVMAAILEARPQHADRFLARRDKREAAWPAAAAAARAALSVIAGMVLFAVV